MSARDALRSVLDQLPDGKVQQLHDFATFLSMQVELDQWRAFGLQQLARAYGDDEPEYDLADLRPEAKA
jgi:hypothetical protein